VYPPLAKTARVDGPVVLEAKIDEAGMIEEVNVISGNPLLFLPLSMQSGAGVMNRPDSTAFRPIHGNHYHQLQAGVRASKPVN